MDFNAFKEKMKNNRYSDNYVESINGKKYMFNYFDDSFYDVSDYKNDDVTITHACLERHINNKVNVINFVRDHRGDWGDDGGYCFYVGKYEGKFILGSNYISYNQDFSEEFINTDKLETIDENEEYMFFDTISEIEDFIERMIQKTERLNVEYHDEWGYESWDLEESDFESPFMHKCIRNLGSAFCEFSEIDTKNLRELTNPEKYTPNYIDPTEFYDSWIREKNLSPVDKL